MTHMLSVMTSHCWVKVAENGGELSVCSYVDWDVKQSILTNKTMILSCLISFIPNTVSLHCNKINKTIQNTKNGTLLFKSVHVNGDISYEERFVCLN